MRLPPRTFMVYAAGLLSLAALCTSCKIESGDSVIRSVGVNVGGVYRNTGGLVVSRNTGARISHLDLIQDGDRLQAVDNNGLVFKGTIGAVQRGTTGEASATFNLKGQTTAGAEGVITGTISVTGTKGTMRGTWAEPSLFSAVYAEADVAAAPPDPGPDPTPSPSNNNVNVNPPQP